MAEENLQNNVNNTPNEPYGGKLKPLRTYQGDVYNAIHKTKASVITIAVAESGVPIVSIL